MVMSDDGVDWSRALFDILFREGVRYFAFVPDAGNAKLIECADAHPETRTVLLTTEEEGVAFCAGIDLVGGRAALLLQSSGVGNCGNFLTLAKAARAPILLIVSMRGEYGERNPWQYPSGQAAVPLLQAMGVAAFRIEERAELAQAADAATAAAFLSGQGAALVLSQRFLGAKAL